MQLRSMVQFRESLQIAIGALRANKARGVLTTLGIIIGIVAVVLTMTAANGLQNKFRESFSSVGTDIVYVSRMPWVVMNDFFKYRNRPGIQLREARLLEERFHGQAIVNPSMSTQRDVKFHDASMEGVMIIGTTEKQSAMSTAAPEIGRFLLPYDVAYKKYVCVIGAGVQKNVFGAVNPLNKTMRIGRTAFRVIGVMEKQGGAFMGGPNFDNQIFLPITTFEREFTGHSGHEDVNIAVKAPRQEALADLEYAVTGEMRKIRRLRPTDSDNFSLNKLDTLVGTFNNMMGIVLLVGLLVTSISLFVGAIGVMNIMFVTVTERTREIGIRKAIGATKNSILMQFLLESSAIGLLGGLVGILIAVALTAVINALLMPATVSWPIVVVAVTVSAGVGILAGVAPAYRGAKLDPIEALRYD
jgi:putative ABC transport system permease protein